MLEIYFSYTYIQTGVSIFVFEKTLLREQKYRGKETQSDLSKEYKKALVILRRTRSQHVGQGATAKRP